MKTEMTETPHPTDPISTLKFASGQQHKKADVSEYHAALTRTAVVPEFPAACRVQFMVFLYPWQVTVNVAIRSATFCYM